MPVQQPRYAQSTLASFGSAGQANGVAAGSDLQPPPLLVKSFSVNPRSPVVSQSIPVGNSFPVVVEYRHEVVAGSDDCVDPAFWVAVGGEVLFAFDGSDFLGAPAFLASVEPFDEGFFEDVVLSMMLNKLCCSPLLRTLLLVQR